MARNTPSMPTADDYRNTARGIAAYLAARQGPDGGFPGPDHYGKAFAARLWSQVGEEYAPRSRAALAALAADPPRDHGEFNAYALLAYPDRTAVAELLPQVRFGHRHSANWMLLRAVCRAQPGPWHSPRRAAVEARAALLRYGRKDLIYDRPHALSHTYHAFCGALLVDLWRQLRAPWAQQAATRAARGLLPYLRHEGELLSVGRGKGQIFGYGALLHLMEAAAAMTGEDDFRMAADRAFRYLLRFRRGDGSFPLVLDANEPPEPWTPETLLPGWNDYNRYADYLPFLGVYLLKAGEASR